MASGDWDPMLSDYQDPHFNAYMQGVGRDLANGDGRGTKLYVDNFPVEIGQEGFFNLFAEFGRVLDARLKRSNREDGKLTYGFVTMNSAVDAERALSRLNRRPLKSGIQLVVKPALTDDQKRRRDEKKQMEADFMSNLGRSNFNRDDDMMSSVSAFNRQSDWIYEQKKLTAQARAVLERAERAYDYDKYLNVGRGHRPEMAPYSHMESERPFNLGRGRAKPFRDSFLHGLSHDYSNPFFGGMGRGRGRGWNSFEDRPRPGPGHSQLENGGLNIGRGSLSQMSQPSRPKTENLKICIKCGAEDSTYRCQACKAYYCSHECQRKDWPRHRDICLDVNVHNFNMKYSPQNGMDHHSSKPIQNQHQHRQEDSSSSHSGGREYGKPPNYHSEREGGGKYTAQGKNFKQNSNRGYESEAGGGGGSMKNQNKLKSFNKPQSRNGFDETETSQTSGIKGKYQERNSGLKEKKDENEYHKGKKESKPYPAPAANNSGDFRRHQENYKDNRKDTKTFNNSNYNKSSYDNDSRPQRTPIEQCESDNKKKAPAKAKENHPPGPDRKDGKQKQSPGSKSEFDFNRIKPTETEQRKAPKRDTNNVNNRPKEDKDSSKAKANSMEDAGSGDASCDLVGQNMEVGTVDKCFITHYDNPSKFWITLKSEMGDFLTISEEFKQMLLEMPKGQVKRVKAGDLYCMIDEDFWARVKIVTVGQGGNLTVFFPDVGKQEAVHVSLLFPLDDTMRIFPAQAMCCCIGSAKPKTYTWNEAAKSAVENWLGGPYNKDLSFKVLEKRGNTHALQLINEEGDNLAKFLISKGLAEASDQSANLPRLTNRNADAGPASVPERTRFMAKDLDTQASRLKEGDKIGISSMELVDLTHFTGHVDSNTGEALSQIETILKDLDLNKGRPYCPVQGELVLTKFSSDNCWYRSEVSSIEGDKFNVLFLDYGNSETVKEKDIRKIEDRRLASFPTLGACFQLWGVDPKTDEIKEELAQDNFAELLLEFSTGEGKWSVMVKGKQGSTLVIDFISSTKEDTFSKLFNKSLSARRASRERRDWAAVTSLPHETLPTTGNSPVVVHFVESCSSFYVVHEAKLETWKSLMIRINEEMESLPQCHDPAVENLVVASYGELWYRAQIKSVMRNEKQCKVFYLDYGNCENVSMENLYQLPEWASSEPALAVHCSLDVDSVNLSPDADNLLKSIEEKLVTVSVLRKGEGGDKCVVRIFIDDGSDLLEQVTLVLKTEKMPSPSKSPSSATSSQPAQAASPQTPQATSSQSSQAAQRTGSAELFPVSDEPVMTLVTHIQSLSEFFIQGSKIDKLADLMGQLQKSANELIQVEDAPVGTLCVAKFEEDNMWYRVQITCAAETSVTVKFIDYGNSQEMPKKELRELPDFARSLCPMGIPCCFKEFEENLGRGQNQDLTAENHSGINVARMKAELPFSPVLVTVYSHRSGSCIVTLMDTDGNNILDKYKMQTPSPSLSQPGSTERPTATPSASQPPATLDSIPVKAMTATNFKVVCTCMENLTEFFLQPAEPCLREAVEISEILKTDLASIGPGTCEVVERGVYGCLFEDEWYRCVVEEVKGQNVRVRYIDWGNGEERDGIDLRPLQPNHLAFPITLMRCQLHRLKLVENSEEEKGMLQAYIKMLQEKMHLTEVWVDIAERQADLCKLVLLLKEDDRKVNINEDMVVLQLAEAVQDSVEEEEDEEVDEDEEEVERKMKELQKQMEELRLKKSKKK